MSWWIWGGTTDLAIFLDEASDIRPVVDRGTNLTKDLAIGLLT